MVSHKIRKMELFLIFLDKSRQKKKKIYTESMLKIKLLAIIIAQCLWVSMSLLKMEKKSLGWLLVRLSTLLNISARFLIKKIDKDNKINLKKS